MEKTGSGPEDTMLQKIKNRKPDKYDEIKKELEHLG